MYENFDISCSLKFVYILLPIFLFVVDIFPLVLLAIFIYQKLAFVIHVINSVMQIVSFFSPQLVISFLI